MKNDIWPLVHAERTALIADLAALPDEAWETPSLCEAWTVHDVVAHLVNTAKTTRRAFVATFIRAGFDFDRQNARGVARERAATPGENLTRLREAAHLTATAPAPADSRLAEEVLHGEDIRRPLGLTRTYPEEAVLRALHYQARTPTSMGGAKQLIAGIHLRATDADLSLGEGPEVSGPALSLLLAISGRRVALPDLTGPGLPTMIPT